MEQVMLVDNDGERFYTTLRHSRKPKLKAPFQIFFIDVVDTVQIPNAAG